MEKDCARLLSSLGGRYGNLVVLCTDDVFLDIARDFESQHPGRSWNMGLSLLDLIDTASGLAHAGKLPVVCAPGMQIAGGARGNIRDAICVPNLNVKIIGVGVDTDDIAVLSMFPNLKIFCPADKNELKEMLVSACDSYGPAYIRLPSDYELREQTPV